MIIAIDFDGTVVQFKKDYTDTTSPFEFMPGALAGLAALKKAGHQLILFSARANRALRIDWQLNPLWKGGVEAFLKSQAVNEARYQEMVRFAEQELPGVFAYVDDGSQGKVSAELFIDDRGCELDWKELAYQYGEPADD